jgi:hypothetical protein
MKIRRKMLPLKTTVFFSPTSFLPARPCPLNLPSQSRLLFPFFIFSQEREKDWCDGWHDSKRNTEELKRKEILMYKVKEK